MPHFLVVAITWAGCCVLLAGGTLLTAGLLWLSASALNEAGRWWWNRMASIYKLAAMQYWFRAMDKAGTHALRRGYSEALEKKEGSK